MRAVLIPVCLALAITACATSPLGRHQLSLFPSSQMQEMGVAAYQEMKNQIPVSGSSRQQRYVRCVADSITAQVGGSQAWEVTLFEDDSANAFALPGGKIGVHTGLLEVARNQHQLAAVIGHEVAHVLANHSNERVSQQALFQTGLQAVQVLAGATTPAKQQLLGLLGVGAQVGVLMPFGRTQETEADLLGLDLMAKAGFDPRESVDLWQNMASQSQGAPPEFLSTHPAHGTRIQNLQGRMNQVVPLYEQARSAGRRPNCG